MGAIIHIPLIKENRYNSTQVYILDYTYTYIVETLTKKCKFTFAKYWFLDTLTLSIHNLKIISISIIIQAPDMTWQWNNTLVCFIWHNILFLPPSAWLSIIIKNISRSSMGYASIYRPSSAGTWGGGYYSSDPQFQRQKIDFAKILLYFFNHFHIWQVSPQRAAATPVKYESETQ